MRQAIYSVLVCVSCLSVCTPSVIAQRFEHAATFRASNSEPGDLFGSLVDLSGDVAIVRSRALYGTNANLAQTHVFEKAAGGTWSETDIIRLPEPFDQLAGTAYWHGDEVSLDQGQIMLGSLLGRAEGLGGQVRTGPFGIQFAQKSSEGWNLEFDLYDNFVQYYTGLNYRPAAPATRTVTVSGGTAIASDFTERFRDPDNPDKYLSGVHLFEQNEQGDWEWTQPLLLQDTDPIDYQLFGTSLALEGDVAAITESRPHPDFNCWLCYWGTNNRRRRSGPLHIFERDALGQWQASATIEPGTVDFASSDIEISGSTIVAHDWFDGSLAAFDRNTNGEWEESFTLPGNSDHQTFTGRTVAIEGDLLAVTREDDSDWNWSWLEKSNVVEVYRRVANNQWELIETLSSPDAELSPWFGSSLALDGGRLLVGAAYEENLSDGSSVGAAYLFTLVPEPLSGTLALFAGLVFFACRSRAIRSAVS